MNEPNTALPAPADAAPAQPVTPSFWLWVLCLLGVDYFSTLAYQPSISFQVAGRLAPLATVVVVLVTLGCALPVYFYVAGKSAHGAGSIALLERLVGGWRGKTLVLGLLGFAATDFVMIKTLSLADAAEHVLHNTVVQDERPLQSFADQARVWSENLFGKRFTEFFTPQMVVTILIGVLGFVFWWLLRKGFSRNVVAVAVPLVGVYLLLNAVVIGHGLVYLAQNPERLSDWLDHVHEGRWALPDLDPGRSSWPLIAAMCVLLLPQMALGLSGFELSLIVMPQVKGEPGDDKLDPRGRVRNTRKVLVTAALIMSVFLLGSVLVTTVLIPPQELQKTEKTDPKTGEKIEVKGKAHNRALAYLAHGGSLADREGRPGPESLGALFGPTFGTIYDIVTVLLLSLAGTSVMTALAVLLPQFLLRFGMELGWAHRWGVLLGLFALVNLAVTLYFRASVDDQRGAYATGVMVLMTSAAAVTYLSVRDERHKSGRRAPLGYGLIALLFAAVTVAVIITAPTGLIISFAFIVTILTSSVFTRALRADELRTTGFVFKDNDSKFLWESLVYMPFPALVPHRPGLHERNEKERTIRADHQLDPGVAIVFLEVEVDDPSNFYQELLIEVMSEDSRFVIKATRCTSVAHAIASVALEMSRSSRAPAVHFGWSEMDLLAASWSYFAFGEGNVPWKVRELIQQSEADADRRPRVVIG